MKDTININREIQEGEPAPTYTATITNNEDTVTVEWNESERNVNHG